MRYSYVEWKKAYKPFQICDDVEQLVIASCETEEQAKLITISLNIADNLHADVKAMKHFCVRTVGEADALT